MIDISAGFLPLTDSAILVVAKETGIAEEHGIALNLVRETSWANVRDRLAVEQFDIAHSLAPMPIASNLGIGPFSNELIAPMALGLGGNAVSVSVDLYHAMSQEGDIDVLSARSAGEYLSAVVKKNADKGKDRLQFGVVHPFSAHNFEFRYWLASSSIRPDIDVDIVIVPPPLMADALAAGQIDGFCVGEPWNSVALEQGAGRIVTVKSAIWSSSPEKVLAVSSKWARRNEDELVSLLRALYQSAKWCADEHNKEALALMLSKPDYLNVSDKLIMPGLTGALIGSDKENFIEQYDGAATFPWQSHALWLYTQMVRWGQVEHSQEKADIARGSFRPDIYRAALSSTDAIVPTANSKVEGALKTPTAVGATHGDLFLKPDGFFDGKTFDPDQIEAYINSQYEL